METKEKQTMYIVMRNDKPSTGEKLTLEEAQKELDRWKKILKRFPDGSKVTIKPA